MDVVTEVGSNVDDESEPTWDEAVALLEAGTPVQVTRPQREVTVIYRYADRSFTATSPDITGLRVTGSSLYETREFVQQALGDFLDPSVKISEWIPGEAPENCTTTAGRTRLTNSLPGIVILNTSGAARTFVSTVRASLGRVRTS